MKINYVRYREEIRGVGIEAESQAERDVLLRLFRGAKVNAVDIEGSWLEITFGDLVEEHTDTDGTQEMIKARAALRATNLIRETASKLNELSIDFLSLEHDLRGAVATIEDSLPKVS